MIVVGGTVTDGATPAPVAGATVRLDEAEQETVTDALGRFRFDGLQRGLVLADGACAGLSAE